MERRLILFTIFGILIVAGQVSRAAVKENSEVNLIWPILSGSYNGQIPKEYYGFDGGIARLRYF